MPTTVALYQRTGVECRLRNEGGGNVHNSRLQSGVMSTKTLDAVASARILIADDDHRLRKRLAVNLQLEGYLITEARDGAQAVALIEQNQFDLVISDFA